ncbi:MAG: hypothetical protein RLZ29_554, partial [Actinomycetota bacterium]
MLRRAQVLVPALVRAPGLAQAPPWVRVPEPEWALVLVQELVPVPPLRQTMLRRRRSRCRQ